MIRDAKLIFSTSQTFCSTDLTTQAVSTNTIDLGAEDLGIGHGTPLYLNVMIESGHTANVFSTGYVDFKLDHDTGTNWADTGPGLFMKRVNTNKLPGISGSNGYIVRQAIPGNTKRHLRMIYTRGLNADTAFTNPLHISAWISGATPDSDVGT